MIEAESKRSMDEFTTKKKTSSTKELLSNSIITRPLVILSSEIPIRVLQVKNQ